MKIRLIALLLGVTWGVLLQAQQEAQFTQYMFNQMAFNPAFAGARDAICTNGLVRQQWMGLKDPQGNDIAPRTILISLDAPVRLLHGGLGATIVQDQLGFEKNIGAKLSYAYRFFLGNGNMSVGLQAGFLNKTIDFSKFIPIQENDPVLTDKNEQSTMMTDFGFGLYYQMPEKFHIGLASTQLSEASSAIGTDKASFKLKRHYYLNGGYEYTLPSNPSFEILPFALVKSDGSTFTFDVTGLVRYNGRVWGGLTYRFQDAASVILGMNVRNFNLGYSYDLTTSQLGRVTKGKSTGSHEVWLSYCFKIEIEKPRRSYRNTRFL